MANFTGADRSQTISTFDVIAVALLGMITFLSGLLIQSFIVAVNVNDWMKGRAITGADKIITSLGISRIFFYAAYLLTYGTYFHLQQLYYRIATYIIFTASYFGSLSLSTLLSIFFYFKISTFHNIFFLWLKTFISRQVVYLITAIVLCSMLYSSTNTFVDFKSRLTNSTNDFFSDNSQQMYLGWNLAWNIFPLLMFFAASVLLLILFGFHIYKMNKNGNTMSSADTYRRTMKFTVFSFLTTALYIVLLLIDMAMQSEDLWFDLIMNMFLALHSVLVIYASTKLRNQFFRIVHCGTNALCNRNAPGPQSREMVEVTPL